MAKPQVSAAPIEGMSLEQLQDEFRQLAELVSTADGRRRAIDREIKKRERSVRAKSLLHRLTPDEREALRSELEKKP